MAGHAVLCIFVTLVFDLLLQAKAGCILNVIGILSINLGINTWGKAMFQLDTFPVWAYNTSKPGI